MMKVMKKIIIAFLSVVLLLACGNNKTRQAESVTNDDQPSVEQSEPETIASSVQEKVPEVKEDPSTPISSSSASSSRSHKSSSYDNMRGFDPASEDDMDDNGMSRYMENNDEEGWD